MSLIVTLLLFGAMLSNLTAQQNSPPQEKVWPTSIGSTETTIIHPADFTISDPCVGTWQVGNDVYPVYRNQSKTPKTSWYVMVPNWVTYDGQKYYKQEKYWLKRSEINSVKLRE
jgi:hypothetical protein